MPFHLCPLCKQPGRLLDVGGYGPFAQAVDYYRCDDCWHAWSYNKAAPLTAPVSITELKRPAFSLRSKPERRSEVIPVLPNRERRGVAVGR